MRMLLVCIVAHCVVVGGMVRCAGEDSMPKLISVSEANIVHKR